MTYYDFLAMVEEQCFYENCLLGLPITQLVALPHRKQRCSNEEASASWTRVIIECPLRKPTTALCRAHLCASPFLRLTYLPLTQGNPWKDESMLTSAFFGKDNILRTFTVVSAVIVPYWLHLRRFAGSELELLILPCLYILDVALYWRFKCEWVQSRDVHQYGTRGRDNLRIQQHRTATFERLPSEVGKDKEFKLA
ncbi:hypothetical protein J6590_014980 [Homalodisca vitripennis]|nr:hypothetical protein J6590_014980 [Homalodisca vitripennis]